MKKITLIFITILFSIISANSQELPTIIPSSPDIMSFQKYGDIPVSYYTGIPSISIPIYTLTTKTGLKIPLSLSYHAGGIKVDEKANRTGLGWSLNTGGVISKRIKGAPDFGQLFPRALIFDPSFILGADNDDYFYALGVGGTSGYNETDSGYDIYSYNFLGKSGKFFIDNDDNVQLIPNDNLKIVKNPSNDIINITDDKGNVFYFEHLSYANLDSSCELTQPSPAWVYSQLNVSVLLTKIVTHLGEEIIFNYTNFNYSYLVSNDETDYNVSTTFPNYGCSLKTKTECLKTMNHGEPVLTSIIYDQTTIDFKYSNDTNYPINGQNVRTDLPGNHALRKIEISFDTDLVEEVELKYDYFIASGGSTSSNDPADGYRLKLTEVVQNNNKKYSLFYNETTNLPKRLSYAQDMWGYYNGEQYNSTLLPEMNYGSETFTGANRNVSATHSQANILTKIEYPTKGYSEFVYENNTYYDATANIESGGLRISKIINSDGNELEEIFYEYTKKNSTQSSGIVQGQPDMFSILQTAGGSNGCKYLVRNSSNLYPVAVTGNSVGYSYVTEYKKNKNQYGRTEYEFTNFGAGFPTGFFNSLISSQPDETWKKGLLLNKSVYNATNDLIFLEENQYEFDTISPSNCPDYYYDNKLAAGYDINRTKEETFVGYVRYPATFDWNYYFIESNWVKLIENKKTRFYDLDEVVTTTNYYYDKPVHMQVTKTIATVSDGKPVITKTYYPDDVINLNSLGESLTPDEFNAIAKLKDLTASNPGGQHRIAEPIQVETYRDYDNNSEGGSNELLNVQRTNYKEWPNTTLVLPEVIQTAKGVITPTNSLLDRLHYNYYDNGNVKEVSKSDGAPIVYIWGYDEQYPIAKIENTTYSVIEALPEFPINFSIANGLSTNQENALRTLPNTLVTTYTYDPLIGVTSITDPRGYTTFYEYDDFNRLERVKDSTGKILSHNEYHYKNQ